jgi:hypothetical protein
VKKYIVIILVIILFSYIETNAQNLLHEKIVKEREITYPQIPRASAYEVYSKFKEGKAIIFHAGGEQYNKRHILGAFNLDVDDSMKDRILPRFPKEGVEIFAYCY